MTNAKYHTLKKDNLFVFYLTDDSADMRRERQVHVHRFDTMYLVYKHNATNVSVGLQVSLLLLSNSVCVVCVCVCLAVLRNVCFHRSPWQQHDNMTLCFSESYQLLISSFSEHLEGSSS